MTFSTTDLCDQFEAQIHAGAIQVLPPVFQSYGGQTQFYGQGLCIKVFEDNTLIKQILENENGAGRVLVIDAGASVRCAVVGGNLAGAAVKNGWQGIIVDGAVRDVAEIAPLPIGVLALALHPLRAIKRNTGVRDIAIMLQGVRVNPLDWIYADAEGVLVSAQPLL